MEEVYDDLAILECYDYRCGYCFTLLAVYADVNAYRNLSYTDFPALVVRDMCGAPRIYFGFQFDHLHGRSYTDTQWYDLVPSCKTCNNRKGHSPIPRWLARECDPVHTRRRAELRARKDARAKACASAAQQDLEALLTRSLECLRGPLSEPAA